MSRPTGNDVTDFSRNYLWNFVVSNTVPERINVRTEFSKFLTSKGYPAMLCEEFSERNVGLILTHIVEGCEQWESLGIPMPLYIVDQLGSIVTWLHPKFENISGRTKLPQNFSDVWAWVRACYEREFLFCCAAYLFDLGCTRVHITDTTGDGGIDVIGIIERGPFRGLCFLVQAKTAQTEVTKETIFSDYTKYILLRHHAKWDEYRRSIGIDKSHDGAGVLYLLASNLEFNPAIKQAARDLPIILRSGRQIAHSLSKRADVMRWQKIRDHVGQPEASLTRNLAKIFSEVL
jgi:hypothetical protein